MANFLNFLINLIAKDTNVHATFTKVQQQVNITGDAVNSFNKNISNSFNKLKSIDLGARLDLLERSGRAMQSLAAPGVAFEQGMADLSAITGITGKNLDFLGDQARKAGRQSGLGAAQAVNAYKVLASQIEVSKIGMDGLNTLQAKTITLAKASGMDIESAALSLSGTINQFGLEASEAERVINVLAAGSKYGAAEIPELAQSFKVVGAAANAAGLSVEQTAGAIEVLSKNNLKGAEAGTALRNIVLKMQTTLGVDFKKTSMSEALDLLRPKLNDATYLSKVFGMENVAAAQFMITNSAAVQEMTDKVTGSNVAQEQAAIRSQTMADRMAVIRENVENLKIGFFNMTGGVVGYVGVIGEMAGGFANLIPLLKGMSSCILYLTKMQNLQAIWTNIVSVATLAWTGVQWALNAAFRANPLTWIIALIVALVGAIIWVCSKITGWGSLWKGIVGFMKYSFLAFVEGIKLYWSTWINGFMIGINYLLKGWYKFKNAMGLGDENENNAALEKINADTEERKKAIAEGARKVMENTVKAQESLGSIEMGWKKKETAKKEADTGIAPVKLPGTDRAAIVPTNQTSSPSAVQQSSESAVTGGTKSTNITINLGKFMDSVNIHAQEFRDGLNDLDNKVLESLTRVLTIAQSSVV